MNIGRYFALAIFALAGCQVAPSPTSKTVTTNDVVGVWSYTGHDYTTKVSMTFV